MAGLAVSIAGLIAGISSSIASAVNRNEDNLERRRQFTQTTVKELSDRGYNAVIVAGGYKSLGHTIMHEHSFGGVNYTVFAAPQDQFFIVENRGDGGYENWALSGTNWVRWGKIVKFHTHFWDENAMGKRFEVRDQSLFPGWALC
jgi:hypothetical protein